MAFGKPTMAGALVVLSIVYGCSAVMNEQEINARIGQLLANMTLEQKARQLDMLYGNQEVLADGALNMTAVDYYISTGGISVIHDLYDPGIFGSVINTIQSLVLNATGIPVMFVEEGLHGLAQAGKTVFPQSIGMAATFNTALMQSVASAIATETRAYGVVQLFAPVIGTATEPRWGRVEETFGECPFLSGELTYAWVVGAQGGVGGLNLAANTSIISEPKHYLAHSPPEGGTNTAPAHVGMREVLTNYAPQFEAGVARAGARGIMAAYSEIDGVPNCANNFTLTELLRNQWGFKGWVLGDDGAVQMMQYTHATAASPADAIVQFLTAGGNCQYYDYPHDVYQAAIVDSANNGTLDLAILDSRVADMLRVKLELGLFDAPYTNTTRIATAVNTQPHRDLALQAARESIVLLQNNVQAALSADGSSYEASPLLPLKPAALSRVVVIGPTADVIRTGDYSGGGVPENFITVLEGVKSVLSSQGSAATVEYVPGCQIEDAELYGPTLWPVRHAYLTTQAANGSTVGGLSGSYYTAQNGTGTPAFTRNDYDINFAWYVYGPNAYLRTPIVGDPISSANFSVKWSGTLTAPVTASGGMLGVDAQGDPFTLTVNGVVLIDTFPNGTGVSQTTYDFVAGQALAVELFYSRTPAGQGVTLQWSLLPGTDDAGIAAATQLATGASVAILVVGENDNTVGEWRDMPHLNLTGRQQELILAVAATGTPVVVVLLHGRSLTIPVVAATVPAILSCWFPGQAQGQGIAEVLFGLYNPAGRLPMTFPLDVGQLPMFYNYKPSARRGYVHETSLPLFPFGHGLSYTQFNYSRLVISPTTVPISGLVNVSFTLANVGEVAGEEVPQMYIRDDLSSVTTPVLQLRGFDRLSLAIGASLTHTFVINVTQHLWLIDRNYNRVVEPGNFTVWVGPSSGNLPLNGTFTVVA